MSIRIIEGDLLSSDATYICQQVNCKGVMNKGLARQIRVQHPQVYQRYKDICAEYNHSPELLGSCLAVPITENQSIANLFGQYGYGNYGAFTRLDSLEKSLSCMAEDMEYSPEDDSDVKKSIALPYGMGCGYGGESWSRVYPIIEKVFKDRDIDVQIWKLPA